MERIIMTPSKSLLNSITRLKECVSGFAFTTAALAPYPVGTIGTSKKKKRTDEKKKPDSKNI